MMRPSAHAQFASISADDIFRGSIRRLVARPAAIDSRAAGPQRDSYQASADICNSLRRHSFSSLDHYCVVRPHSGGPHRAETLLRALSWISSLDFTASDPDRYDGGNVLYSPRSLGAVGVGSDARRVHRLGLGGIAELSLLLHFLAGLRPHRREAWLAGIRPACPSIALWAHQGFAASRIGLVGLAPATFSYARMDNIAVLALRHHYHCALGHHYLWIQSFRRERHRGDPAAQHFQCRW